MYLQKSKKQKNLEKNLFYVDILKASDGKWRIRIRTRMSQIHNDARETAVHLADTYTFAFSAISFWEIAWPRWEPWTHWCPAPATCTVICTPKDSVWKNFIFLGDLQETVFASEILSREYTRPVPESPPHVSGTVLFDDIGEFGLVWFGLIWLGLVWFVCCRAHFLFRGREES